MRAGPSWDDLRQPGEPVTAETSAEAKRYAELCALVFSTGPGKELLALMRARTIEQRTRPGAPEAYLREEEAVRRFVAELERSAVRGRDALVNAKAKAT